MQAARRDIIEQLRNQINAMQGNQSVPDDRQGIGLGLIENAFPGNVFPRGVVHELISTSSEEAACTSGFISVILDKLMLSTGFCMWISTRPRRSIYPPALKKFGIDPDRVLFVDTNRAKETLWALEEALKCPALAAVVGEITELDFNDSRRLQLAVEKSQVTGFIHRFQPKTQNAVACVSRWKITPLASSSHGAMPGLGFPRWNVQLLKVRNGNPGEWQLQYAKGRLDYLQLQKTANDSVYEQQTA